MRGGVKMHKLQYKLRNERRIMFRYCVQYLDMFSTVQMFRQFEQFFNADSVTTLLINTQ